MGRSPVQRIGQCRRTSDEERISLVSRKRQMTDTNEIQKKRVASRPNWRTDDDEFDPYEVRNDPAPHDCKDQAQRDAENAETTHPADFFSNQLRPNDGAICYAAVFGDYSLDD
ncbi:unnamed protein product [Nesidiocoris tenuis]|uniref:Uncharacterized protein n=1 Tax=Nesidiocoris tenuis TaxID=355587 RepID=A0A6H5G5C9_9HEMI|nr:unnamed protein product [Nesidiocoris tenuis]